jgi:hypothetical protein
MHHHEWKFDFDNIGSAMPHGDQSRDYFHGCLLLISQRAIGFLYMQILCKFGDVWLVVA